MMKPKMHQRIQLREITAAHSAQFQVHVLGEVQEEIQNFLRAVDSYPERVAKEPSVTFQQHLGSIFAAPSDRKGNDKYQSDIRLRRY
jgi:queuine/archaeosine tRNA-ribosyltransferase